MAKSAKVIVNTQGGPLTEDDFESEAPMPGSSDHKYSTKAKAKFAAIGKQLAEAKARLQQ